MYQHPPMLDPASYEQWQINYALAMSMNEQTARQQHEASRIQPAALVSRDVSTKGQAEALSYRFWATGRCVPHTPPLM